MLATVAIWILATTGLAVEVLVLILPWSFGLVAGIDPIVARTYFWWFGHPLTYFWLVPAYVLWYTVIPRVAGGKLFSDAVTRVVFVQFILFSTPVGFHHQFTDPGMPAGWKLVHTFTTYAIMFPSLVTAFTVIASLELAGRMRGGTGLFGWIARLPWSDPFFASVALAMITFALGGFGGAINAAYAMNAMIHNTAWIQGHFHLTVGTAVALSFMGVSYWMLPRLTGRALVWPRIATLQPYLWFVGMQCFSIPNHIAGVLGMPRRVYTGEFQGVAAAQQWVPLVDLSAIGGVILFVSAMCYVGVLVGTMLVSARGAHGSNRVRRSGWPRRRQGPRCGIASVCGRRWPSSSSSSLTPSRSITSTRWCVFRRAASPRSDDQPMAHELPPRCCSVARFQADSTSRALDFCPGRDGRWASRRLRTLRLGKRSLHAAGSASDTCISCSSAARVDMAVGATLLYQTPDGHTVNITRRRTEGTVADFIALSSTCRILDVRCDGKTRTTATSAPATTARSIPRARPRAARLATPACRCRATR